jgi:AraC family transcriptional regulator, transcriptional activator of pobA
MRGGGPIGSLARERQPIAVRVAASEVQSHFEVREWRLASKNWRGFDWALLLTSGGARLDTADKNLQVLAPAFVWIPAASVERLAVEAGGSGHLLSVRRDLIEQTIRQMPEAAELVCLLAAEQPLVLSIEPPSGAVVARILTLVASELHDLKPGAQTLVSAALVICLVQLWRQLGASAMSRASVGGSAALLMRFRQLVDERFREHWPVSQYARALGVTPDRLHAICTQVLGRSPRTLLNQRLLHEALVRLERSAITVKQLAHILGFRDAAYFSRFFVRLMGTPPARYRRENMRRGAAGSAPQVSPTFADWP